MKTATLKIKKTIRANVSATAEKVKIKFPQQSLGCVSIHFNSTTGAKILLRSFELMLCEGGDKVKVVAL